MVAIRNKVIASPSTVLFPVPVVLVTSRYGDERPDIITIAWTGVMNSMPPMVYIGVQPVRHSYKAIRESREYVINIPSADMAKVVDYCGVVSGRDVDKFKETGLTPLAASRVKAPLIKECPVNLECRVKQVVSLGSHDVFIAEVLAVHYNEDVLDEKGNPDFDRIKPYGYCAGEYRLISGKLGYYGYSKKE